MSLDVLNSSGKPLSKQAIDGRFSAKSILFIRTVLETYLRKTHDPFTKKHNLGWMDLFGRILVKDGTRFDLPEAFRAFFEGFGGTCTSDSAMCIQFEYDLKTGRLAELNYTSANIPDSKDAQPSKDKIQPGDLILRDLGYFGLNIFEEIIAKKAYFISKLNTQTLVYQLINGEYKELDFVKIKKEIKKQNLNIMELEVFVGKTHKIPTRMVLEPVPDQVYEGRIRKARKNAKKKGYSMSREYAARQRFNCYITNVGKDKLPAKAIRNIYRLRWQVELVFKIWKSTYHIHKTHKMKYERWMTLFYARMFLMLIHWQIYHLVKHAKYERENKLLSISKSLASLKLLSHEITALMRKGITKFTTTINKLVQRIETKHDMEKKKGRVNQQEIIDIIYCISDN